MNFSGFSIDRIQFSAGTVLHSKEKVKVSEILSSVDTSGKVTIKHKTGKELTANSLIGTGSKVIVELASETIEYTLIVNGDTTGDGVINIADVVKIADHTLSGNVLDSYEKTAAEITGDGRLNIADVVKLADYTLNKNIEIWR